MSDTPVTLAMNVVDRMSGPLGNISKAIDEVGTRGTAANKGVGLLDSALGGIGAGVGIAGVLGLSNAVGSFAGVMGGAVRSAMEEEAGISRLSIAVRDAIPGWNGNTKAIEDAIHARIGLGFQDDVLRTSIGSLVARTHDVDTALRLQSAAMDIARFRGVDLGAATDAVGKAFDGSATALKRMGIAITAGATGEQALAQAIQATAGQADAYANTSAGKLEAAQNRVNESMQKFGTSVLPVLAGAAGLVADAFNGLSEALDTTTPKVNYGYVAANRYGGMLQHAGVATNDLAAETAALGDRWRASAAAADATSAATATTKSGLEGATVALSTHNAYLGAAAAAYAMAQGGAADYSVYLTGLKKSLDAATASQYALDAAETAAAPAAAMMSATGFRMTGTQNSYNAALAAGIATQNTYTSSLKAATTASGGASAATKALAVAIKDSLATAYDALKIKATAALDAIHAKNLQQIEDTGKMWDKQLDDKSAAFQAPVDAAQKALDDKKKAEEKASLQSAIDTATDNASRQAAQTAMDDWMEQERINQMQADANVQKTMIANAKTFDDQLTANKKKAEDDRYAKQKKDLDAALALLKSSLSSQSVAWAAHLNSVLKIIGDKDPDFVAKGKATGKAYGDAVAAAIKASQSVIAAAVASVAPAGGGGSVPGRASGGPVMGGSSYIVGERGPELFVPGQSGSVIPNGGGGRGGGGGNVNLSVTISGAAVFDPMGVAAQQVAAALLPGIRRELGRQGVTF